MSKSPEFPTILLVTGWATASTVAAFLFATTGSDEPQPAPAAQQAESTTAAATQEAPAAQTAAIEPAPAVETAVQAADEATSIDAIAAVDSNPAPALPAPLGIGRPALPEEIDAWDVTVLPDGTGLPIGSGDVLTGEEVFGENCAACHGDFAEGLDSWPVLAGGDGTLTDPRPVKTVGSYWPHLSTVFDYVHRSMPFGQAQTLSADDTYAITAYLLYSNGLVEDDFTLTNDNFTEIIMPNADGFYVDDRAVAEYPLFVVAPCMENCLAAAPQVTKRAVDVNVTPEDEDGRPAGTLPVIGLAPTGKPAVAVPTEAASADAASPVEEPAEVVAQATSVSPDAPDAGADPALIAAGEKVFGKCASCHKVGPDATNAVGPALNAIVGGAMGQVEGFGYSATLEEMGAAGGIWDAASLHAFLESPRDYVSGTKMAFAGLKKAEDRDAIIAYLATFK